jgi:hypothetical protein
VIGRNIYYLLDPITHQISPTTDEKASMAQFNMPHRVVQQDHVGEILVSTVFLVIDHGYGSVPQLFETMVFDVDDEQLPGFDDFQLRYPTWDQALAGHQAVLYAVQNRLEAP